MKKIFLASALFMFAVTANVFAQNVTNNNSTAKDSKHKDWITIESTGWGAGGVQTLKVPNGKGTISFIIKGDRIGTVTFTDETGRSHNLQPAQPGTNGAPQPSCKYPLPDACFATSDKNIGLCICKPTNLTNTTPYTITLRLPAVQKVREAAN